MTLLSAVANAATIFGNLGLYIPLWIKVLVFITCCIGAYFLLIRMVHESEDDNHVS